MFGCRQLNDLFPRRQVAVIATPGSGLIGLSPASALRLDVGGVLKLIGAVATGLLLGTAAKTFGSQLADLPAELFVFLFQGRDSPYGIGVSAPPISGLLPPLQILTPQAGHFGAQLIDFCRKPRHQRSQIWACGHRLQKWEQHAIHDSCFV